MKNLLLLLIYINLLSVAKIRAQATVNVNLGNAPAWAPAKSVKAQYYYLPEIDTYYDVPQRKYIYRTNNAWVRSSNLPARNRNYNLKKGKIVYINDYRGNTSFKYHKKHKNNYYHPKNNSNKNGKANGKKNHD